MRRASQPVATLGELHRSPGWARQSTAAPATMRANGKRRLAQPANAGHPPSMPNRGKEAKPHTHLEQFLDQFFRTIAGPARKSFSKEEFRSLGPSSRKFFEKESGLAKTRVQGSFYIASASHFCSTRDADVADGRSLQAAIRSMSSGSVAGERVPLTDRSGARCT